MYLFVILKRILAQKQQDYRSICLLLVEQLPVRRQLNVLLKISPQRQLLVPERLLSVPSVAPIRGANSVVALLAAHGTTIVEQGLSTRGPKDLWSASVNVRTHVWVFVCCFMHTFQYLQIDPRIATTRSRAPSVCTKCGANKRGKLSCCAPGGAWYNNCGAGRDHSWDEGSLVCKRERSYACLSVCLPFHARFSALRNRSARSNTSN